MQDIRCGQCRKKLGTGEYSRLSIKCPRCGAMNELSAMSTEPERLGASDKEDSNATGTSNTLAGR